MCTFSFSNLLADQKTSKPHDMRHPKFLQANSSNENRRLSLPLSIKVKSQPINIPKKIEGGPREKNEEINMSAELENERNHLERILKGSQTEVIHVIPADKEKQELDLTNKKQNKSQLSPLSSLKMPRFDK